MSDEELRARLLDLHDAARSVVIPPGVEKARRTVRRRRVIRTAMASAVAVALGLVAFTIPKTAVPPPVGPTPQPTPALSPSRSAEPTPTNTNTPTTTTAPAPATVPQSGGAHPTRVGLQPYFLEYGTDLSTVIGQDASIDIPIGVMTWGSGTATGVKLTVDVSQISSRVDILAVSSPCSRSGSTITCNFGTLKVSGGGGKIGAMLSLRGKPGGPLGRAGKVYLHLAASVALGVPDVSGTVSVDPSVTDLAIAATVPVARIGQTVTMVYTVKNQGPVTEPWITLLAESASRGTQYVGGDGCAFTATTFSCRIDNLAVGQTRAVKVMVKVTSCPPGGDTATGSSGYTSALNDPNMWNESLVAPFRVQGC